MFDLILLFFIIILFILSFVFLFLDLESYQKEKNETSIRTFIPKRSKYALLFGLLALTLSVIISIGYA